MSSRKGRIFSEEHKRKLSIAALGRPAWNKGKPMSDETKIKLSLSRRGQRNSPKTEIKKNPNSFKIKHTKEYYSLHRWIRREKGNATYCLFAKTLYNDCSEYFDWANIDGKYRRSLDDYIPLCRKHHFGLDKMLPEVEVI